MVSLMQIRMRTLRAVLWITALWLVPCGHAADVTRLPRTNLLIFHNRSGEVRPVKSKSDWEKRRAEILRGFASVAGELPGREKRCRLDMRVESKTDCGSYERWLINYQSEPGGRVPAYLCLPKTALTSRKRAPAILCLHPTDMQYGHRAVVEKLRDNYRSYGHDLAERGFVVLAPAYPIMASYNPDLKALGWQSGTMKAVWDNKRGLDLLDAMPFVKRRNYGVIGHSLGGHNAIYTAVLDDRIKVVVSSCGFDSFPGYYHGDPKNWQPERGWCQTRYMPKLADYRGRLEEIPFDFHELLGALAPRTVFVSAPVEDANFRAEVVDEVVSAAATIYRLYGATNELQLVHPPGGHDFPEAVREQAYQLLEEKLGQVRGRRTSQK
jgi:pimeloyl-ACP methyl ester carboxylesterase